MDNKTKKLRKKLLEKARKQTIKIFSGKDIPVIKAVSAINALDEKFNSFYELVRDWYSLYFPELEVYCSDSEKYLLLVLKNGLKKNFVKKKIEKILNNHEKAVLITESAKNSVGGKFTEQSVKAIQGIARLALETRKEKQKIALFLEKEMQKSFPCISRIAGTIIGAKMIAQTGGIKKLAFLPSSTIQVLGAEKALFRHLKTNSKPPKHGFLFQHPLVKNSGKNKGKTARFLAGKISIAAKTDFFKGNPEKTIKQLEKELKEKFNAV